MTEGDNGNGRITLAVLGQKMDEVLRRLDSFDRCNSDHEKRLTDIEKVSARREEQITNLRDDINSVKERDTAGTLIAGVMAGIAGVIAWFK